MNNYLKLIAALLVFLTGSYSLESQPLSCIEFESLENGAILGESSGLQAGAIFYEEAGVPISLKEFYYFDGTSDFLNVFVTDDIFGDGFPNSSGIYVFPSNINLHFDFTQQPAQVSQVCMSFIDGGGEENIAVNGQPVLVVNNLYEIPQEIAPEVTFTIFPNTNDEFSGTFCLDGAIESLTIGGQEFGLDNVCFVVDDVPPLCSIQDFMVAEYPCTESGVFFLEPVFQTDNPSGDGYKIFVNDVEFGPFSYDDDFPVIGPFPGESSILYEIVIVDIAFDDCYAYTTFGPIDCNSNCDLGALEASLNCNGNYYELLLDINPISSAFDYYDVYLNDEFFSYFTYEDFPLSINDLPIDDPGSTLKVKVCENDQANCCSEITLFSPDCNPGNCIGFEGYEEDTFGAFTGINPGEIISDENGVPFSVEQVINPNGNLEYDNLYIKSVINYPDFYLANGDFAFFSYIAGILDFSAFPGIETISFDFTTGYQFFNIGVNGNDPVVFENLIEGTYTLAPGITVEITIQDEILSLSNAIISGNIQSLFLGGAGFSVDNICAEPNPFCALSDLELTTTNCTPNGQFFVELDFEASNSSTSYVLYIDEVLNQNFDAADLPLQVGPFEGPTSQEIEFEVKDAQIPDCIISTMLAPVDCIEACTLEGLTLEVNCNPNENIFALEINLEVEDGSADGFEVWINGENTGTTYTYDQLPIIIDGLEPSPGLWQAIEICDIASNTPCCISQYFTLPCPPSSDCEMGEIFADILPCETNTEDVYLEINFEVVTSSDTYMVHSSLGVSYGPFNYEALPQVIGPFPPNIANFSLLVQDSDNFSCQSFLELGEISCEPAQCELYEPEIIQISCNGNGDYSVLFDFQGQNTSGGFQVTTLGGFQAEFEYQDIPYKVNNIPITSTGFDELFICDNDSPNCCISIEYDIDCPVNCSFSDVVAEVHSCDSETGSFFVDVAFTTGQNGASGYYIFANEVLFGPYEYGAPFVTIGPFAGNGTTFYDLLVVDGDDISCFGYAEIGTVDCQEECFIDEEWIEIQPCNNDGTFDIHLALEYEGVGEEGFTIIGNGVSYGEFEYGSNFYEIGPFEGNGNTVFELIITDNQNPNCGTEVVFGPINCNNQECQIWDLFVEPQPCTPNGIFYVDFEFNYQNVGEQGFSVIGNGMDYGDFDYGEPFYTVGPFEGNGTSQFELIIIDNQNPNCGDEIGFGPIDCNNQTCQIYELHVEPLGCNDNGTYNLVLNFEVENPGNEFFDVFNDEGEIIGTYLISDLPVTVENFEPRDNEYDYLRVCINDNPDCCKETEFLGPDCNNGECQIWDLFVEPQPCTPNGIFYVDFEFNYQNVGEQGFSIIGNGMDYGDFDYGEPFYTLGPFLGDGETQYELIIIDNQIEGCSAAIGFGPIDCNNLGCEIYELHVEPLGCNDNGTYNLVLNFEVENPGNEFFDVFNDEGEIIGTYLISDLPVTIENFEPRDNEYDYLRVCINDNPDCCKETEFLGPDCNNGECQIWDLFVEPYTCEDGLFYVDFEFNYQNVGEQGFSVIGNGMDYGDFDYGEPFYTVGPFLGDGETQYELIIIDNQIEGCSTAAGFGPIDCNNLGCEIYELHVEPLGCNDNGTYNLVLNFEVENPGNEFFDVFNDEGEIIGTYLISDLPVTVENFEPRDNEYDYLRVCINDNPDCCKETEFIGPDCNNGECQIWDLFVEPYACEDGLFYVDFEFNYQNVGEQGFSVIGNGMDYGDFDYGEPFYTVGPFLGDGETQYELIIIDNQIEGCSAVIGFGPIDCNNLGCEIYELSVEPLGCNDNGTYNLVLNFEVENPGNEFFEVFDHEGEQIGFYELSDLPITVENFEPRDSEYDYLKVCINDNPGCCAEIEFMRPDCNPGACNIYDLIVEAQPCNPNGVFQVDFEFQFENVGSEGFQVFGNGMEYGSFEYGEDFYTVGFFPGDGISVYELIIQDVEYPGCTAAIAFGPVDCYGECSVSNLEVTPQDCNNDGTYDLVIDFDYQSSTDNFFDVFDANGGYIGFYYLSDLPVTLVGFDGSGEMYDYIKVCINDNEDCCADIEFAAPECAIGNCLFSNPVLEVHPCDEQGMFLVDLEFDHEFTGEQGFNVLVNNTNFGVFSYEEPFITVGPFEGDGESTYIFQIFDVAQPECGLTIEQPQVTCFEEEVVWPGDANSDNIAHHFDLLNLGIAFGTEGPARAETDIAWQASSSQPWSNEFADGTNYQHADCNGDGIINEIDVDAIAENYGLVHGVVEPFDFVDGGENDPPLYVRFPNNGEFPDGASFEAAVVLGSAQFPLENIYGLAFQIEFNPEIFELNSLDISVPGSWLGEPGENLISIYNTLFDEGKIEIALSKTDLANADGFGDIVYFTGIIDDIAGIQSSEIRINDIRAIDKNEVEIPLFAPAQTIEIITSPSPGETDNIGFIDLQRELLVYPNPTRDWVYITNPYGLEISEISLLDLSGEKVITTVYDDNRISLADQAAGVYLLRIVVGEYTVFKKITKM